MSNPKAQRRSGTPRRSVTRDEKKLDTNEVDDKLYVVHTRVSWGKEENQSEELVRYVRQLDSTTEKKK